MLSNAPITAMLSTTDIQRAEQFYTEVLGLNVIEEFAGDELLPFQCGDGTMLVIYQRNAPNRAEHTQAGWQVVDLDEVVEVLSERGVVFEHYDMPGIQTDERGIANMDNGRVAWFKDPDGNILSVGEFML